MKGRKPVVPEPVGCAGQKDVFIAIDASKSVKDRGWDAQSAFAVKLIEEITKEGNPSGHKINVHWFNTGTWPVDQGGKGSNTPGQFSESNYDQIISAVKRLNYDKIRGGATDHPQVYMTAEKAFRSSSSTSGSKVLVMITDGETHKGHKCGSHKSSDVERKIGRCKGNRDHACYPRKCSAEKCLCGLYTAELFKGLDISPKLIIVGIANQNHIGDVEAGVFKRIMSESASPGEAYIADNFEDLATLVPPLVDDLCKA